MRIVNEKLLLEGQGKLRSGDSSIETKEYLDRVAKYIPTEVVVAYISANGLAESASKPEIIFPLIFVACFVCTPIYITRFTTTSKEAWTNGIMALFAFVIWAYATGGGLFKYWGCYDAPTASVLLIIFTLASGLIQPTTKQPPSKPEILND